MKISGLFVVKNEWPLLAVTISHALTHHCAEVWVIDNGSTDNTRAGIEYLNSIVWNGRIHYFHYSRRFDQAAITSYGMRLVSQSDADFILVLDGDEFLVTKLHQNFALFLESKAADPAFASALAVQVITQNFAVKSDFDLAKLDDYVGLQTRTIPNQENVYNEVDELARKINSGEINFFDNHPWNFRAIPRSDNRLFVTAGTHQLTPNSSPFLTRTEEIVLAHLPVSSAKKIMALAQLEEGGVQILVAQASAQPKTLAELWAKVTVPIDGSEPKFATEHVEWLSNTLRPIVAILTPHWEALTGDFESPVVADIESEAAFHAGVLACRAAIDFILTHA
ncbi:MAG: glycosyltransferase family 2 protein [Actinomycetes bacterium]